MTLTEHPDREALTLAVAQAITEALGMALKVRERAVLCLPGGSTPVPVFKALAAARLEWDRVIVIPSDERWVPPDHSRSNARLIRRNLIEEGAVAELIELYAEGLDPQAGAAQGGAGAARSGNGGHAPTLDRGSRGPCGGASRSADASRWIVAVEPRRSAGGVMCAGPGAPHGAWPLVAADVGTRGCRGPAHKRPV